MLFSWVNYFIQVLCSLIDQILILSVLLHSALIYYLISIKNLTAFVLFSYAVPFLLNHLPYTVRSAPTYMSFRRNLKTYLFNHANPT